MFIQVAIDIPSERTFTYAVPPFLAAEIALGKRVRVPFGRRRQVGVILAVEDASPDTGGKEIREILDVLDPEPLFGPEELRFYRWAASYYLYPLGKALADVLPGAGQGNRSDVIDPGQGVATLDEVSQVPVTAADQKGSGGDDARLETPGSRTQHHHTGGDRQARCLGHRGGAGER